MNTNQFPPHCYAILTPYRLLFSLKFTFFESFKYLIFLIIIIFFFFQKSFISHLWIWLCCLRFSFTRSSGGVQTFRGDRRHAGCCCSESGGLQAGNGSIPFQRQHAICGSCTVKAFSLSFHLSFSFSSDEHTDWYKNLIFPPYFAFLKLNPWFQKTVNESCEFSQMFTINLPINRLITTFLSAVVWSGLCFLRGFEMLLLKWASLWYIHWSSQLFSQMVVSVKEFQTSAVRGWN